ncbi:MAG: 50S ribosomal protein L29 [Planctomycetia bacterium]
MTKVRELRDMGEEQIRLVWKDAAESLFRLRIQAQTEKLASPAEMRKHRRTIARCQTILTQRGVLKNDAASAGVTQHGESSPQHEKHAKKHHATGRAKLRAAGKGDLAAKRQFKKRTQSGS